MSEPDVLFDELQRVKYTHVSSIINHLKSLTVEKTQNAVAHAINVLPGTISQMKSGTGFLYKKHIATFAQAYSIVEEDLLDQLALVAAGSTPTTSKMGHTEHSTLPPQIADPACIIADPKVRDQFLSALQRALDIPEGVLFRKALNNNPVADPHTNYQIFILSGQVPRQWINAILDPQKRNDLMQQFDPKRSTDISSAQQSTSISTKKNSVQRRVCTEPCAVPQEFFNAFFHACIAAGKAIQLQLAVEAFLGTLSLKLQHCTVSSRVSDSPDMLIVTIHNGKVIIEYHLNVSDFS